MALFGRKAIFEVVSASGVVRSYTDLRVRFSIEMSRAKGANRGIFSVFNARSDTVALLRAPGTQVRMLAGYDVARQIFAGTPVKGGIRQELRGSDRIVSVEATDGGGVIRSSRVELSFSTGTSSDQVLAEILAATGLPRGVIQLDPTVQFSAGFAYTGDAWRLLDILADSHGADWMILDGVLHILPTGTDLGEPVITFSSTGGTLIGSPVPREDGRLEATALLEPSMRPGRLFAIESSSENGIYIAEDVRFSGDGMGFEDDFFVTVVGTPKAA